MKSAGGFTSLKYSLDVAKETGFGNLFKTLLSKNTCKTCALGMGGQMGGMRNEDGDFPEVCKKSIQAELTDIQPEIPLHFFSGYSIAAMRKISPLEIERSGRLNHPLYKKAGDTHYSPLTWEEALEKVSSRFKSANPARTFFYNSGRSSNEAAFLLQLFVRLYGTNNINNCSYYCHQASGVGLKSTIGVGTATVALSDLACTDLFFLIGANPASNHPRFLKALMRCNRRGGKVVVINPVKEPGLVSFAIPSDMRSMLGGGSRIASEYIQPHIGGDIALLKGIAKEVIEKGGEDAAFIQHHTHHFDAFKKDAEETSWEEIIHNAGVSKETITHLADLYMSAKHVVFAWAMGITHHDHGVENVEAIVNLALLRGMVGKEGAGLLPLRGHSNVQGIGTMGVTPALQDAIFKKIESSFGVKLPQTEGMDTMACMHAAYRGEVDAAFIMGGNLYASNPDSVYAAKALNNIPFKVFVTTTLNHGHVTGVDQEVIILPTAARDEEKQATTQESMFSFVRLSDGGIVRLSNVRSEVDIVSDIAIRVLEEKHLRFAEFKNHDRVRKAIALVVPGMEELEDIGRSKNEFTIHGRIFHRPDFATSDRKASFKVIAIPLLKAGKEGFRVMTVRSEGQFNSVIYEEKDLFRKQTERWIVMMNPSDMQKLGLKENACVALENVTGKMERLKVRPFDIAPGNLMVYYPESNVLVPNETDARSKTPSFKSIAVNIVKQT